MMLAPSTDVLLSAPMNSLEAAPKAASVIACMTDHCNDCGSFKHEQILVSLREQCVPHLRPQSMWSDACKNRRRILP